MQGTAMLPFGSPQKQLQKQLPPDIAMAGAQWGSYPSPASLDALLDWLNPKGGFKDSLVTLCSLY